MISEIERAKVLKQLDDAAEAIRNNPASDFTEEELRKKIEAVSTEEGLEMWSRLLKVAAGEPRPRSTEKVALTAEVLKDTADRLNDISEVTGISVGEQIDRLCFNFHPYDAGLAAHMICESMDNFRAEVKRLLVEATKPVVASPTPTPTEAKKYYRVQIGAYTVKANADATLAKAKAAGFTDAFVRYGE